MRGRVLLERPAFGRDTPFPGAVAPFLATLKERVLLASPLAPRPLGAGVCDGIAWIV